MTDIPEEFAGDKALNAAQEKAIREVAAKSPVIYTKLDQEAAAERKPGENFVGNLTEFQLTFEWVWDDPENKTLIEKSTNKKFSGWIHIKDDRLDEKTYPGQEQKIKFDKGVYQFVESLDGDAGTDE